MGTGSTVPTVGKSMCVHGDLLTIYQRGGIVYFLGISQRIHLQAPFTTSNKLSGRDMAAEIRRGLMNALATCFNTQIYDYPSFVPTTKIYFKIQTCF